MSEVRVCENCNHINNINNLECEKCGFDLSFVIPVEESELQKEKVEGSNIELTTAHVTSQSNLLNLVSADKQLVIPIVDGLVIGREGAEAAYFEKSNYVSRKHAIFYIENGEVMVLDASTNGTFINGKRMPKLTKTPIHCSDKITFADLTFEVEYAD